MSSKEKFNTVRNLLRRNDYEEEYEEINVVVHPGFYEHSDDFDHLDGLNQEDYLTYKEDLIGRLEDTDTANYVFHRKEDLDEVRPFLGSHERYVDEYVKTSVLNGIYLEREAPKIASLVGSVKDDGRIVVSGEMNGFCTQQAIESFENIEQTLAKDIEVEKGDLFPYKELQRTEGVIHWKEEETPYSKALRFTGI